MIELRRAYILGIPYCWIYHLEEKPPIVPQFDEPGSYTKCGQMSTLNNRLPSQTYIHQVNSSMFKSLLRPFLKTGRAISHIPRNVLNSEPRTINLSLWNDIHTNWWITFCILDVAVITAKVWIIIRSSNWFWMIVNLMLLYLTVMHNKENNPGNSLCHITVKISSSAF